MSTDSFVAIDVETANADLASICQIGLVTFADGQIVSGWQSLIDPEDEFNEINISIHGIDESSVQGAPHFNDLAVHIGKTLEGQVVASHTSFDRVALHRVHTKYALPMVECRWLDTARVVRRAWTQFAKRGYGLAQVSEFCGIQFQHHSAVEDARAAGEILVRAISETGLGLHDWLVRIQQPIDSYGEAHARAGNPDGELFGEEVVFTGALSMSRREATDLAATAGCAVPGSVRKTTTLLVVGDQDIRKLGGKTKSSKHRKAEQLISEGQPIRVLTESDFRSLVRLPCPSTARYRYINWPRTLMNVSSTRQLPLTGRSNRFQRFSHVSA